VQESANASNQGHGDGGSEQNKQYQGNNDEQVDNEVN
jgi:hypothetical protein